MSLLPEAAQNNQLCRFILDHALGAFIAVDEHGKIIEWNRQAEEVFGWTKDDILDKSVIDTLIPPRHQEKYKAEIQRLLTTEPEPSPAQFAEVIVCQRNGEEIPVELNVSTLRQDERRILSFSAWDASRRNKLEHEIQYQASLTQTIIDSMPDAVAVSDESGHLILVNPAAQRLLNLQSVETKPDQTYHDYQLLQVDGKTPYPEEQRPMARALRGEHVQGALALVRHENLQSDAWVSINARPLNDEHGKIAGGILVFHDITELRLRENELRQQAHVLRKRVSLLELSHDAIVASDMDDIITFWNHRAEDLYGIDRNEAIGRNCHDLLKTTYPVPLAEIKANVHEQRRWQGEVRQRTRDGREIIAISQWALELKDGIPWRYLQTYTDITQTVQTEQALRESEENYRLLVETTIDFGIIMTDPGGVITSWNPGAEKIFGMSAAAAIGQPVEIFSTQEDRSINYPAQELEIARTSGRAENIRWHMRKDGSRFWANGVTMPLRNRDGSLRGYVKIMRDQTAARLAEEQTQFLALHDPLTGLPNRVHFSNQLHSAIAQSERSRVPLAVLMLDLDRFKYVNDTFGHHVGDLLLKEVATRVLSSVRETDTVARLGGDEFIVIQTNATQPAAAMTLAKKLIHELGQPYRLEGNEILTGTSIGISSFPADAKNPVDLVKHADLALYQAKNAGRGNFQCYTVALSQKKDWKKNREQALREAIDNNKLSLYYQPQVDLSNWKITTVEALLRWQPDDMDVLLPDDFLGLAEETGLIVRMGEWALRQACTQAKKWQTDGMGSLRISLNCSAKQFGDPEFVNNIRPILEETGLAPSCLELEVTESLFATHPQIKSQLVRLRSDGVHITIDNYGTGTVALIDLKEFEVDGLKIDKAFVQHLPHRRKDSAIASAIISLAHELGIHVSAGGVETAEQLAYLKARDCTSAQGFLFSPPIPAEKFEQLILSGHWSRMNRLPQLNDSMTFKDLH